MGDRIRIGEIFATIGTAGLVATLVVGDWMTAKLRFEPSIPDPSGLFDVTGSGGGSARDLGWFAFATLVIAAVAAALFLLRAVTATGSERPMLQAPIAYVFSGFAFLVLLVRLFVFPPGETRVVPPGTFPPELLDPSGAEIKVIAESSVATVGYLGLLFVWLIVVGLWIAMSDDRTGSAAAKARTAALLAASPLRTVPPAVSAPDPDSAVVADDGIPTDPAVPADPAA